MAPPDAPRRRLDQAEQPFSLPHHQLRLGCPGSDDGRGVPGRSSTGTHQPTRKQPHGAAVASRPDVNSVARVAVVG